MHINTAFLLCRAVIIVNAYESIPGYTSNSTHQGPSICPVYTDKLMGLKRNDKKESHVLPK